MKLFKLLLALLLITSGVIANNVYCWDGTDGAILAWTFDDAELSGGIYQDVCNVDGNDESNGTVSGATTGASGKFGEATSYDGINDVVYNSTTTESHFTATDEGSINAWVMTTTNFGATTAFVGDVDNSAAGNFQIYFSAADVALAQFYDSDGVGLAAATSTSTINSGYWTMITLVYWGNTSISAYINGTLEATATHAGINSNGYAANGRFSAGAHWKSGAPSWVNDYTGSIDEISVYNYTLNATDLSNLYTYNNVTGAAPVPEYGYSTGIDSPVYEANNETLNVTVWFDNTVVDNATAGLYWNNTVYTPTAWTNVSVVGTITTIRQTYDPFIIPLIETNGTTSNVIWNVTLENANATTTEFNTTTDVQTIYYGYYWDAISPDSTVLAGATFDTEFNGTVTYGAGATLNYWSDWNGTTGTISPTITADQWSETDTFTAPDISGDNETLPINGTFNVTFTGTHGGARTYERTNYSNVTIHKPQIVNCSGGVSSVVAIRYLFKNEVNVTTNITSDMDLTVWVSGVPDLSVNYTANFSFDGVTQADLCLYPTWATIYVDSFQVYTDTGSTYRERNYFLNNASLTNTTNTLTLYNIQTTLSSLLTLTIVDDLVAQEGDFVSMERYYPGENLYRTVEVGMTDEDGKTFLYPVPNDVYYRFVVVRDYETVYSGDPREIGIATFTIDTGGELTLEYFDYEGISVSCSKAGDIIGCSLVNPSGLSVGAALLVREIGIYSDTEICYTEETQVSTTTILCNVSGYTGRIQADLMFIAPNSLIAAWTETFNGTATDVYGGLGLFITVLIITGSALLLAYSPALSIIGALLGLVISVILGITALSLTSLVLILVAGAFLFVKVKT